MNTTMVTERVHLAKVLVAGAPNVGKTSLVNNLVFEGFTQTTPTIGVNFAQKICHGESGPVNFSIWDLSGHERFRCLMPRFCQGASGVILVFDVTAPKSLEAAKTWLEYISSWNSSQQDFVVILVGNKTDFSAAIPHSTIQEFCIRHHITSYIPCSAKTGENVKRTFETLCSAIQRNRFGVTEHTPSVVQSLT